MASKRKPSQRRIATAMLEEFAPEGVSREWCEMWADPIIGVLGEGEGVAGVYASLIVDGGWLPAHAQRMADKLTGLLYREGK